MTTLYEWAGGQAAFERLSPAADVAGLPGDPEFRSALVAYLEWGWGEAPPQP